MQSKVWEAKVGVPKLLGIQLPLGNYTEDAGVRLGVGGVHRPATRPGPETPKLLDIQAPLGHMELGMSWGPVG